jgi:hypothetical protein
MAFKNAPRIGSDDDYDRRQYQDVAPISADTAKHASGLMPSTRDMEHRKTLDRAKGSKEDVSEVLGAKEVPALYKIEVFFGPNRTATGPNSCTIKFWESGRRLHGGGDDLMFMCKNRQNLKEGCGKLFSSDFVRNGIAICPKCQKALNGEMCVRSLAFRDETKAGGGDYRIETRKLAALLATYWRRLDGNADIYLKFDQSDIRYRMVEREMGPVKAKELRGLSIYPLRNIIFDTANGTELELRMFAFLTA